MRSFLSSGLLLIASLGVTAINASGQAGFTLDFDENGNGQVDLRDGFGFQPLAGVLAPDPTQPGNPLVLTYFLTGLGPLVNGDIRIWEDSGRTNLSDVMRFTDVAGNLFGQTADRLIFYSDIEPGEPNLDLADTGIPPLFPNDGGGVIEVGPEGMNGFQWAPAGLLDNVFNGISDVPEIGDWCTVLAFAASIYGMLRLRPRRP